MAMILRGDGKEVSIDFPIGGIDRSRPHARRVPFTTDHARNVWPVATLNKRYGGGRRPALARLWTNDVVGEDGSTLITAMESIPVGAANVPTYGGTLADTIAETFVDRRMEAPGTPTDIGADWVVWRKDYATGGPHYVGSSIDYRVQLASLAGAVGDPLGKADFGGLMLGFTSGVAGGYPGVASAFATTNSVELVLRASGIATNNNGNVGDVGEPTNVGPCVRQAGDLSSFIMACLTYTGVANQVRLDIIEVVGAVRTTLASSVVFTLSGTAWGTTTQERDGPTILLEDMDGVLRASCSWQAEGIGVGGVQALTCTAATTSLQTNVRAGVATNVPAGVHVTVADRWVLRKITLTRLRKAAPNVLTLCDMTTGAFLPGVRRYFVPQNCTGYSLTTAGVLSTLTDAGAVDLPPANVPYLDYNQWRVVQGKPAVNRSQYIAMQPPGGFFGESQVEVRGRTLSLAGIDTGAEEDVAGVVLRLTNDSKCGILIEVQHGADLAGYLDSSRQDHYTHVRLVGMVNGARFVLATLQPGAGGVGGTSHMAPFHAEQYQRWEDDGGTLGTMTITLKVNGIALLTITPSALAGWGAFSAALSGAQMAEMSAGGRKGLAFWSNAAAPLSMCYGGRLVDPSPEDLGTQVVSEHSSVTVAIVKGKVWYGSSSGGEASLAAGRGPLNSLVHTAVSLGNLFMVDGDRSLVMPLNLALGTVSPTGIGNWEAGIDLRSGEPLGVIPTGASLLTSALGRLVVGRMKDDPTAFFLTRAGNPFDMDFNADPIEGSAQAGVNSPGGGPAVPITGLMPFGPDGLIVAGPDRLNALVGEPTLGGRFVNLTRQVGMLQSKAWCFDDRGVLYVIGSTGLWRVTPDGTAENVDRNRLGTWLSEPDAESYFWQLGFDPLSKTVHIIRSHITKGNACVHGMYHPETDSLWENTFDADGDNPELNPWAVCTASGTASIDRRLLMGGQDGAVRRFLDAGVADAIPSGTAGIVGEFDVYPEYSAISSGRFETMIETLAIDTAVNGDGLTGYWFVAPTFEEVAAMDVGVEVASFAIVGGANEPVSLRQRGLCHKVRFRQTSTPDGFAFDRATAIMSARGRRR